ncbi:MAG: stage II sporulation protein M [Ruminococcaceae bacterium]|nr:stage II sporulation protein M [Oscillospiraceae bacterium]
MKGIVFSVKHSDFKYKPRYKTRGVRSFSFKRFFSFYGIQTLFLFIFVLGIVLGSFSCSLFSSDILKKLDFLFLTNLETRLEFNAFDLFCSSFASYFIFTLATFLLGFTAWGVFVCPFLCAFKGYAVGISSAYMFSEFDVTGIGFYILIVLPGTVMFLFSFITALKETFSQSTYMLKAFSPTFSNSTLIRHTKIFLFRYFIVLIFVSLSAIIDMILWLLFANMFNF